MDELKIRWTKPAEAELFNILDYYYVRNGNFEYSQKMNNRIEAHIKLLKTNPFLGKQTKDKNIRSLIAGNYQILYECLTDTILIVMIWDCRRNPENKVIHRR